MNNKVPKVGDYVICEEDMKITVDSFELFSIFLSKNIGQIKNSCLDNGYDFLVQYDTIPVNLNRFFSYYEDDKYFSNNGCCRSMYIKEIKYFSKDREDLEVIIEAGKYNL